MNQILQVEEKKNNYRSSSTIDIKKIVLFFAIAILIFGAILLGQGAYSIYLRQINKPVKPDNPVIGVKEPTITLTEDKENNQLVINIESETPIAHLIYNWNNQSSETIEESGKTSIEEKINIPAGDNILNLSVVDSNGHETKRQENYSVEQTKPIITPTQVGKNIKISVTSKVDLAYVSYRWNSDPENKDDMATYEDKTKFEKNVEIPIGQNTLKIVAVDINNNKTENSLEIRGVTKPKNPEVVVQGNELHFTVEAVENIASVVFTFNGETFNMTAESTFGETNKVHYKVNMVEGMNYLKIVAKTKSGGENTSLWKYEYKPTN